MKPLTGFEPATPRLRAGCSATELQWLGAIEITNNVLSI